MTVVSEHVPSGLRDDVDAALAWWNAREGAAFEVTGILDPDDALAESASSGRTLRLVLCGEGTCRQESFRVEGVRGEGARSVHLLSDAPAIDADTAELDPPPGPRRRFLDDALARHAFVVLVFYRGFW